MGTRVALVGSALAAVILGVAGFAGMASPPPPAAEQVLFPDFSMDVRPGVKARGFIALSKPYNTTESPSRRVRVLAYSIKYLIHDQERFGSSGMRGVDVDGREPLSSAPGGVSREGSPPGEPGQELRPRRFGVTIRPSGELTWGAVTSHDQLDVSVEWVTHQAP